MNNDISVSVIVPIYNHAKYLIDCLESIKSQAYAPIELVLIDDGSRDNSFEIAREWAQKNRSAFSGISIESQENRGICKTLNRLVHMSHGELIVPLASDDMLTDNAIASLVEVYQTAGRQPAFFGIFNSHLINEQGRLFSTDAAAYAGLNPHRLAHNKKYLKACLLFRWGLPFANQVYNRHFFNLSGGYNESLPAEDVYFALWALFNAEIIYSNTAYKKYRRREQANRVTPGLTHEQWMNKKQYRQAFINNAAWQDRGLLTMANLLDRLETGSPWRQKISRFIRKCVTGMASL